MSLFSSFSIGVSGLYASQNSLNTTAHNLANVETRGYVRQRVLQADNRYKKLGANHLAVLQSGMGVEIASVKQARDIFLDKSYRLENGRQNFYGVQYEAVLEIESVFGELEGVAFQDSIEDLWTSIQELAKEPDSIVTRTSLVQSAVSFIERGEKIWNQLKDYQLNLNTQIKDQVDRINLIAEEISRLNDEIRYHESNKLEHANDLRDYRNLLLDELGNMISITYSENANGEVSVNAEGVPLVTEDFVYKMGTEKVSPGSDFIKPVWEVLGNADVFNLDTATSSQHNTDIGSLKGLLVARGDKVANYTDIPVKDDDTPDHVFEDMVREYNNKIETSVIMTGQARFDQLVHSIVTTINDILCPNIEVDLVATDGTKITKILDPDAPMGMDEHSTVGEALFNRKGMERYIEKEIEVVDSDGNISYQTVFMLNEEDPDNIYSLFSLGGIEVNPEILENYSKIPLSSGSGTGDYEIDVAEKLVDAWQELTLKLSPNTLTEYNYNEYYSAFVIEIGNRGQQLNTINVNQASMVNSIDNLRQRTLGVSADEELTNLIKYQHSYNASARYINVIDEMLDHLINRLGR